MGDETSVDKKTFVEQILGDQKLMLELPWLYLICYEDRPLQGIPPGANGPHLLLFTSRVGADKFCRERQKLFGDEPLSVCPIDHDQSLYAILNADSKDSRYSRPPSGLVVDFSLLDKNYAFIRSPQEMGVDDIDSFNRALIRGGLIGKVSDVAVPTKEPVQEIVLDEPESSPVEDRVQKIATSREPEIADLPTRKSTNKWIYAGGGLIGILLVGAILLATRHIDTGRLIALLRGSPTPDLNAAVATYAATAWKTATPGPPPPTPLPVLLVDDFSNPTSGWSTVQDPGFVTISYENDSYVMSIQNSENIYWGTFEKRFVNTDLLIDARPIDSTNLQASVYGVVCRTQENGDRYEFSIAGDGSFWIGLVLNDEITLLAQGTYTSAMSSGTTPNNIRAVCAGDQMTLYVNSVLLASTFDETLTEGQIGIWGGLASAGTVDFQFDDVLVSDPGIPPERYRACEITDSGGLYDYGYNLLTYDGVLWAMEELGISGRYYESASSSDYDTNMQAALRDDCDLIIGVGFLLSDTTVSNANQYPDRDFSIVDMSYDPPLQNVLGQVYQVDEAAFLAGYLAAGMSKSGVVATYGGINIPPITAYMDGFVRGAQHYAQVKGRTIRILGWDPDTQTGKFAGNFEKLEDGRNLGVALMDEGADVIFPVAGPVGIGTAEVATQRGGVLVIGMDYDWRYSIPEYAEVILTSVVKNFDTTTFMAIERLVSGDLEGGTLVGTLQNGGVGLSPFGELDNMVPQWLKDELVNLTHAIIDGQVSPKP